MRSPTGAGEGGKAEFVRLIFGMTLKFLGAAKFHHIVVAVCYTASGYCEFVQQLSSITGVCKLHTNKTIIDLMTLIFTPGWPEH